MGGINAEYMGPPSMAPSKASTTCIDNGERFKVMVGEKKKTETCTWVKKKLKSRCEKYPEAAENCPKLCGICGETVSSPTKKPKKKKKKPIKDPTNNSSC